MIQGEVYGCWTYDAASQITQLVTPQGTQTYAYNTAGQRTGMTEGSLGTTTYGFDAFGRASTVTNRFGETTTISYDANGRPNKKLYSGGQYDHMEYDALGRLSVSAVVQASLTTAKYESYNYNAASEMTSKVTSGVTTTFTYDGASQLLCESKPGYSASYTYDANGNRTSKTLNSVTESYTYDDGDKMLTAGSKSYSYDAAGRTTQVVAPAGTTNLTYDFESRIATINGPGITASYSYNGLDTRVGKTENSVSQTFVRDGVGVTAPVIRDSLASYTPGISERRGTDTTFLHSGLKNAEAQTQGTGTITAEKTFDAFGNQTSSTGTWKGPFGYAGGFGYQEDTSGLKLLGHRYYDSSTGRFLTRDPAKDGRNWYVYCENDPLSFFDRNGYSKEGIGTLIRLVLALISDVVDDGKVNGTGKVPGGGNKPPYEKPSPNINPGGRPGDGGGNGGGPKLSPDDGTPVVDDTGTIHVPAIQPKPFWRPDNPWAWGIGLLAAGAVVVVVIIAAPTVLPALGAAAAKYGTAVAFGSGLIAARG